ncbi:MAG: WD40/YVTN/BNR-like repeat-containing protein [Flavobacteriaceae bacterium]
MKTTFSFLFLTITLLLNAQDFSTSWLKETAPRNIGPGGMSGRITSIDVVISNPNIMYVGTASGGLWKSSSGGVTWSPIFNDQVTASVGSVAIQQSNPDVIWVGTGEGNPRNSLNGGYGIFKSINGGKTWKSMGLENTRNIHRVIIDPSNPNTVYVAAIGSPWGEHPERGIYKTVNGGKSWKKILYVNDKTGAADLVMDPKNPNKLIAAMWEHKRDPWFFKSGGKGSGLYVSFDGGDNWSKKTKEDGLPDGDLGRIGLAIAANKTNIIYAIVESKKNALYKSEDGGFKWKMVNNKSDIGNRPFYYSDIAVDPQNENRVFSVFTYVNVSQDGGKNFSQLMPAYGVDNGVHPDHHAWWIHPNDGSFMIDGNDGGLNITKDGGKTWRFIGNIPVAQFYHISVDNEYPYNVYGGMQDNGSWRGPAYVWKVQGIRNSYWQEIAFGDGFDVVPDRDDSRYGYAMSQQGYVSRYDWKTGNNYIVRPTQPDPNTKLRFNWNAAIGQDPFDNSTVYFGSQFVHKSDDKGLTWSVISPDLTTNDPQKQKQSESGGLTLDATGAENYCTLLVIEPSPVEKNMLWVASDDGRVHFTQNGGDSWSEVTKNIKGLPKGSWITQIKASQNNKGEALLVANDYRRFNFKPYAYRTVNYGKSWERIVDQSDAKSYALSIIEDPVNPNLMFLGTDDGLYLSLNAGKRWSKFDPEVFPTVSVKDLVIQPREQDLIVGTFGRAAWVLDDIRSLRALASKSDLVSKKVYLFEPPTAYLAAYQQPTGSRFGADAMYHGTNRKYGAMMTYYVNPTTEKDSDKENNKEEKVEEKATKDSLKLTIYDGDRLIRTLKKKLPKEKGFYRWYWYLDEKGVPRPRRKPRKSKTEPSGVSVIPGTYRIVLEYGSDKNEQQIVVKSDPRIQDYPGNSESVYGASKKLEGFMAKAAESVKQLTESKQVLMDYQKLFKENKTESVKELTKEMKAQTKVLDSLISLYIGKEDKRQGIIRNPESTVMTRIGTASRYIRSRNQGITATEEKLLQHAKDELDTALEKTNTYFKEVWPSLRTQIEDLDSSRFKEIKLIDLE